MSNAKHGQSMVLDNAWEKIVDSQTNYSSGAVGEKLGNEGRQQAFEFISVSDEMQQLEKRVTILEDRFGRYFSFDHFSGEKNHGIIEHSLSTVQELQRASTAALASVDHNLITSKPLNENIINEFWQCIVVLKRYNFALCQCLLILAAIFGLLVFGTVKFVEAHNSVNDQYKPFKIEGKDEYYRNEKLTYKLPLHYFWFQIAVNEDSFFANDSYHGDCNSTLRVCLNRYMEELLNTPFVLNPTKLPTAGPTDAPTIFPTAGPTDSPTILPTAGPTDSPTILPTTSPSLMIGGPLLPIFFPSFPETPAPSSDTPGPSTDTPAPSPDTPGDILIPADPDNINTLFNDNPEYWYDAPVSALCYMKTANNGTVFAETVGLKNITMHLDEIGVQLQNDTNVADIFGMLIRLQFEDFDSFMSGQIMCDLYLDIGRIDNALTGFASYDIFFMVSREEYSSGTTGITELIRSIKKVWRWQNDKIDQLYSYIFEESTFDGKSDFTAEVNLIDNYVEDNYMLNLEVYPYPTVVNYVSYDRYSCLDWIADIGGFFTLITSIFFILSTRIVKCANREYAFQRKQGLLPAFSLSHRNAEELSALRYLMMAALGITEEDYFTNRYDKFEKRTIGESSS